MYIGDYVRMRAVRDHMPRGAGKCLDVGAGAGIYRDVVREKGYVYYGIDIEPRARSSLVATPQTSPSIMRHLMLC